MLTNATAKTTLVDNLNDIRISAITLFINRLIERKVHGGGINQYRIKNKTTDTYITSVSDFILALDENELTYDFNYSGDKAEADRLRSLIIIPNNFIIELDGHTDEDDLYFSRYGKTVNRIMFLLNYMNDGDSVLPIKVFDVRLF